MHKNKAGATREPLHPFKNLCLSIGYILIACNRCAAAATATIIPELICSLLSFHPRKWYLCSILLSNVIYRYRNRDNLAT